MIVRSRSGSPARATVVGLALADLRHEWILTLCLVLALAAVISPLMILMGLKHGTIETLRCSLVEDPVYREIRPIQTRRYDRSWFGEWGRRVDVGFLTPTILPASSIVGASAIGESAVLFMDLIPTGPNDPLLLENGGRIPSAGDAVLTHAAAEDLGVVQGDFIDLIATRSRAGLQEQGSARVRVLSVLGKRASSLSRIFAPLDLVLDVEVYKEGMAVPTRGWSGSASVPYLSFDGIIVAVPSALRPVQKAGLAINTGLTLVHDLSAEAFRAETGFPLPAHFHAYSLDVGEGTIQLASFRAVKDKLRGTGAVLLPYVDQLRLSLTREDGRSEPVAVFGISVSPGQADTLGIPELPWGRLREGVDDPGRLRQILQTTGKRVSSGVEVEMAAELTGGVLNFNVRQVGIAPGTVALVPAELLGLLRTGVERQIQYDEEEGRFLLARTGFRGFRLYARSIDDVAALERDLRDEGIEITAQGQAIERIRVLDRGLTRVFWLVAVVGVTGGIAALIASLYAAVQRKRKELGVMRLLGLARLDVFRFPIYQGAVMATLSILAAVAGYYVLAAVINQVFAADLAVAGDACQSDQRICALPVWYPAVALVATVCVSVMSSFFAAWKTTRIDPAEALREE